MNGREYSDPPSTDIAFPSNSDMVNYTTNRNVASIKIPPSLIKDNLQDDSEFDNHEIIIIFKHKFLPVKCAQQICIIYTVYQYQVSS